VLDLPIVRDHPQVVWPVKERGAIEPHCTVQVEPLRQSTPQLLVQVKSQVEASHVALLLVPISTVQCAPLRHV
jgi:hypothetical protein